MTDDELRAAVNLLVLLAYVGLVVTAAALTGLRLVLYRVGRVQRPRLLNRDLILVGGHALTFLLVAIVRVDEGLRQSVVNELWWVVVTATPALFAIATYVWYEIFVIAPMYRLAEIEVALEEQSSLERIEETGDDTNAKVTEIAKLNGSKENET